MGRPSIRSSSRQVRWRDCGRAGAFRLRPRSCSRPRGSRGLRATVKPSRPRRGSKGALGGAVIILAGDAPGKAAYRQELIDLIARHGLADKVRLVGHCHDMPVAFLAAYVAVVPSLVAETFGRTSIEAQAMGCPVIVSDLGALPETIVSPEQDAARFTGWLIPPDDVGALADRLRLALSLTQAERSEIGGRASARVGVEFALSQMQVKTLAVYDELLGRRLAELYAHPPAFEAASMDDGA